MSGKAIHYDFPEAIRAQLVSAISKVQEPSSYNAENYSVWPMSCQVIIRSLKPGGLVKFALVEMPGCCMYLISTDTYIDGCYRRKGLSYVLQEVKENLARVWGYTKLFCTVTMDNKAELKVLKKSGWEQVDEGINLRTSNEVGMFVKEIKLV